MAQCAACGQVIVFGGRHDGNRTFCNDACFQRGAVEDFAGSMPHDLVERETMALHSGPCPQCSGPGPVDVHKSFGIISMLILTRWSTKPHVCCRSCGRKHQLGAAGLCAIGGWWGIPWGLIGTPIQIIRNFVAAGSNPDPTRPSADLYAIVQATIAAQVLQMQHQQAPVPGPRGFDVIPGASSSGPPPLPLPAEPVSTPPLQQ